MNTVKFLLGIVVAIMACFPMIAFGSTSYDSSGMNGGISYANDTIFIFPPGNCGSAEIDLWGPKPLTTDNPLHFSTPAEFDNSTGIVWKLDTGIVNDDNGDVSVQTAEADAYKARTMPWFATYFCESSPDETEYQIAIPVNTQAATSTGVSYGDWLLLNVLILFCVAFIPVGTLFSLIPHRR